MIVRTVNDVHYLIRQSEHARQTAVIAAHLRPEFFGNQEFQLAILQASGIHDNGWDFWDASPLIDERGVPLNFDDIPKEDHREIWRRTIFDSLPTYGPLVTMILARHAAFLAPDEDEATEEDFDFWGMIDPLQERAWPGLDKKKKDHYLTRSFYCLGLSDALSLKVCAGWPDCQEFPLLNDHGDPVNISCRPDEKDPWTVVVDPWPFAIDRLHDIHVNAVAVPVTEEADCVDILKHPRQYGVRRSIHYRPN